jgi:arylsulfatase A-like enzyme
MNCTLAPFRLAACHVRVVLVLGFVTTLVASASSRASAAAEPRPNVLLIISDDQGFGDFGFNGNGLVRTPNLDRLAGESAVFRNFVVAAACSPTRSAIYTGRDHLLAGVWGVPPRANLRRDETLMPAFYKSAGYRTLHVGKEDCVKIHESMPWQRGWDESIGGGGGYTHRDPVITQKSGYAPVKGWTADIWTEHATEFIRAKHDGPWFASVAYIIPHMPWVCDEKYSAPFLAQGCSADLAACYGSIAQMDACIGRLLDALHTTGQDRNTIVAFVSDNGQTGPEAEHADADGYVRGGDWAKRNVAGLRGSKATVWENGIRVPFLVRWPGPIKSGPRSQFGCAEDILPTLLDLAGIDAAAQPHQPFTGVSLRPALNDANLTFERPDAFRIAIARAGAPRAPLGIIPDPGALKFEDHHLVLRGPRFKYHALPDGKSALYDLDSDPDESTDVQAKYPEVAAKMAAATRERWDAVIASGRAFRMPTAIVRGDTGEAPPNSRSRLTATAAQSLAGSVRIGREAVGFAKPGDSATYALEVVVPGSYEIVLQGEGLDACAPLTLDVGGQTMLPKRISKDAIVFGKCELLKTTTALRVQAGKSKTQAKAAKLRWIVFIPGAPERAGGKSL